MAHGRHFGVASRGKIIPVDGFDDLIAKFKQFVLKIGFWGVFDIDFYQSCGNFYFGELNLRIGGSLYAVTKMGVNLPGMMVKSLIGESIVDMNKKVTSNAIYVNERMCIDDWYLHYITTHDYYNIINSAQISFVNDNQDPAPYRAFKVEFLRRWVKRILKKILIR